MATPLSDISSAFPGSVFEGGFATGLVESIIYTVIIGVGGSLIMLILRNTISASGNAWEGVRRTIGGVLQRRSVEAFSGDGVPDRLLRLVFYLLVLAPLALAIGVLVLAGLMALVIGLQEDATLGQSGFFAELNIEQNRPAALFLMAVSVAIGALIAFWLERSFDWVVHLLNMLYFVLFAALGASFGAAIGWQLGLFDAPGWALPSAGAAIALISALLLLLFAYGFVPNRWKDVLGWEMKQGFSSRGAIWLAARNVIAIAIIAGAVWMLVANALN